MTLTKLLQPPPWLQRWNVCAAQIDSALQAGLIKRAVHQPRCCGSPSWTWASDLRRPTRSATYKLCATREGAAISCYFNGLVANVKAALLPGWAIEGGSLKN